MSSSVILSLILLMCLGLYVWWLTRVPWRRTSAVLMGAMIRDHGFDMGRVADLGLSGEIAQRARVCANCANWEECRQRLNSAEPAGYDDICSNKDFIARVVGH